MINKVPNNWEYNDSLEMLFLFYQCTDELLSEVTPDTYALPQHNVVTLVREIEEVFDLISNHNRTVNVPDPLLQKLRQHRTKCLANRLQMGKNYTVTDFVIVHPDGKPIYPEYLSQMFTKLQNSAGLPKCRFHDLRHLCASIMFLQGVDVKTAQQVLGHKDFTTTMNIYTHVFPSSVKEAADKVGALVFAV